MAECYLPLENVLVIPNVTDGGIRARYVEIVAQLGQEELTVCSLGCGGILPSLDERVHEATIRYRCTARCKFNRSGRIYDKKKHTYVQSPVVITLVEGSKEFGFDSAILRNDGPNAISAVHFQITMRTDAGDEIADERRVVVSLDPWDSKLLVVGLAWIIRGKKRYLVTQSHKVIQDKLRNTDFRRIHRNALVGVRRKGRGMKYRAVLTNQSRRERFTARIARLLALALRFGPPRQVTPAFPFGLIWC